jgi:hypothetical protein
LVDLVCPLRHSHGGCGPSEQRLRVSSRERLGCSLTGATASNHHSSRDAMSTLDTTASLSYNGGIKPLAREKRAAVGFIGSMLGTSEDREEPCRGRRESTEWMTREHLATTGGNVASGRSFGRQCHPGRSSLTCISTQVADVRRRECPLAWGSLLSDALTLTERSDAPSSHLSVTRARG